VLRPEWLGERELDLRRYEQECPCDWTSGSFMLARREALESAGYLDERFFIYSEETDLCLRIRKAGWQIRHLPSMTILHHADKAGINPKMAAQGAFARLQYMRKNFSPLHRAAYAAAVFARYALRYVFTDADRRSEARRALRVILHIDEPPFGEPAPTGVALASAPSSRGNR
jgi:GT2 family glycosyltransferase